MDRQEKGILITGSSGFIGSNLVGMANHLNLEFTTLDYTGDPDIQCDITDVDWEEIGISNFKTVIHLAAKISVSESLENPNKFIDVNSKATRKLFSACVEHGVERVIFASSAAVYGSSEKETKKIGEEGNVTSPYAETKLFGEEIARQLSSEKTSFLCLRFFNVYGPSQKIDGEYSAVIPAFIQSAISGQDIEIHGDGCQTRDFIHVDDVCSAIISSLSTRLPSFSVVNVGFGRGISILELANLVSELVESAGCRTPKLTHSKQRLGDVRDSTADISGLDQFLDIDDLTPLEVGLRDLIERTLDESNA
jgi:nucleoside-diphosphate-sugar epimerase